MGNLLFCFLLSSSSLFDREVFNFSFIDGLFFFVNNFQNIEESQQSYGVSGFGINWLSPVKKKSFSRSGMWHQSENAINLIMILTARKNPSAILFPSRNRLLNVFSISN